MARNAILRLPGACRSTWATDLYKPFGVSFLATANHSRNSSTLSLRTFQAGTLFTTLALRSHRPTSFQTRSVALNHKPNSIQEHNIDAGSHAVPYAPPKTGILSVLPASWVPYAELARIDKPTGAYYLYFPCLWSTFLAATFAVPIASPLSVLGTSFLFFSGALIMRGAGCAINDLWDRNLDPHVTRTRLRPIARGALSPFKALAFTGAQLFAGLGILLSFPTQCLFYGIPSLLLVATYPLAKRVTHYPQFVLGLTFSWGAIMGFPALGVDLVHNSAALASAGFLYASNIAWTVLYDMIYAHMDIKDDAKAGIKSIALRHNEQTKQVLTGLAAAQIGLLAAAGVAAGAGPVFFVGSCGGAAITLAVMVKKVNLKSVKDCWWWFVNGCWLTGGVVSVGLFGEYLVQYLQQEEDERVDNGGV
jgi:4-hydroxybenzoate polyprenyltransferase